MDKTDSLEGWVAIKEHPFLDTNPLVRTEFLVAWNEVDWRVAITCLEKIGRSVSDKESKTWSRLYTLSEIKSIHEQLALVHPSLGTMFPQFPEEPRGVWSYLSQVEPPDENFCQDLTIYLKIAHEVCGNSLFTSTFLEEHSCEEYFESISELRRRKFDEAIARADDELQNVWFLRSGSINMLDMIEVYLLEDQALFKWNIAMAELYNYLIQPFIDMRELAFDRLREARAGLNNPDLGPRRKDELSFMFTEWNLNYTHALDSIQELYIEYYSKSFQMLTEVRERLVEDKNRFGEKSFEFAALDRYNRVYEDMLLEKLQLLTNKKCHYDNQREKSKQQIASLDAASIKQELPRLEKSVYTWQKRVYDIHLQISQVEEQLVRAQLAVLKHEQSGENSFYDAVESEEDLQSLVFEDKSKQDKMKQLQNKIGLILKKRAQIRNRKKRLDSGKSGNMVVVSDKEEAATERVERENSDLQKKQELIQEERRKTLIRLREFKIKNHRATSSIRPRSTKSPPSKAASKFDAKKPSDQTDANLPAEAQNNTPTENKQPPNTTYNDDLSIPPPPPPPLNQIHSCSIPPLLPNSGSSSMPPPPPLPPCPPPCPPPILTPTDAEKFKKDKSDKIATKSQTVVSLSIDSESIKSALGRLKKIDSTERKKNVTDDPMADMLKFIKQGVKLRKVHRDDVKDRSEVGSPKHVLPSGDSHTQQLMDAIQRIHTKLNIESDDEDPPNMFEDSD